MLVSSRFSTARTCLRLLLSSSRCSIAPPGLPPILGNRCALTGCTHHPSRPQPPPNAATAALTEDIKIANTRMNTNHSLAILCKNRTEGKDRSLCGALGSGTSFCADLRGFRRYCELYEYQTGERSNIRVSGCSNPPSTRLRLSGVHPYL